MVVLVRVEVVLGETTPVVQVKLARLLAHSHLLCAPREQCTAAGTEACGAIKNVISLGAGFVDGVHLSGSAKATLTRVGAREMAKVCRVFPKGAWGQTFMETCIQKVRVLPPVEPVAVLWCEALCHLLLSLSLEHNTAPELLLLCLAEEWTLHDVKNWGVPTVLHFAIG